MELQKAWQIIGAMMWPVRRKTKVENHPKMVVYRHWKTRIVRRNVKCQ